MANETSQRDSEQGWEPGHRSGAPEVGPGSSSSWFQAEGPLLAELRRSRFGADATPMIPGYDGLRELKRGGQGVVYEAMQRSTKRRVAIKVLLDSAAYSGSGRRRFEREIDLAASLRHPNIVRVYDSGELGDGRAYFVMEFAEGKSLSEYAAAIGRESGALLGTFLGVCDAVQHAHLRGVIHRDLKPSNIRVDAEGSARVLDFGIAKVAVAIGVAPDSMATSTGQFVGSLPWASPEQARGEHDQVDARSDVYALGVMLYELLAGSFPYDSSGALNVALNNIVAAAPIPIRRVCPELDEQLEVILAKAMAKEPLERYQSVGELAADIRHHLAGEPIVARRDGAWRVLRRQVARYRVAAVAGTLALLVVSGLSAFAVRSAMKAQDERDNARRQSVRSEAAVGFLSNMLASADPDAPGGANSPTVLDTLRKAAPAIESDFASDPEVRADLYRLMCKTYTALGLYDEAEGAIRRAMEALAARPNARADDAASLGARADFCDVLLNKGDAERAVPLLEGIAALQEHDAEVKALDHAATLSDLGMGYNALSRFNDAASSYRAAKAVLGEDWRLSDVGITSENNLAGTMMDLERFDEAERIYREVIPAYEALHGKDHRQTIIARSNLGMLLMGQRRYVESEELLGAALESSVRLRGADHVITLVIAHNLGTLEHRLKNLEKAEAILEDTVERRRKLLGSTASDTLLTMGNLTFVLADLEKFDAAATLAREVLDGRLANGGERSMQAILAMNALGQMLMRNSDTAAAEPVFIRALALAEPTAGVLPAGSYVYGVVLGAHGRCVARGGDFVRGEVEFVKGLEILQGSLGESHDITKRHRTWMGEMYEAWGKPDKAAEIRGGAGVHK